ncbi:hypothetical protein Scep_012693 [Stephania cephalantha]|uniref:Uncharacterized protein n=1 Tax=Stephania cephalantha TaxID=152367 RepID=A0AAP0P9T3_9MAGN
MRVSTVSLIFADSTRAFFIAFCPPRVALSPHAKYVTYCSRPIPSRHVSHLPHTASQAVNPAYQLAPQGDRRNEREKIEIEREKETKFSLSLYRNLSP